MGDSEHGVQIPGGPAAAPANPADVSGTTGPSSAPAGAVSPSALTVEQLARLLTAAGGRAVGEATIRRHIEAGAPTLADGRLNLLRYVAWLVREVSIGEQ